MINDVKSWRMFKKVPFFLECVRLRRTLTPPAGGRVTLLLAFASQAKAAAALPHTKKRYLNAHLDRFSGALLFWKAASSVFSQDGDDSPLDGKLCFPDENGSHR
jgi:hypothetical protein